MAPKRGRDSSIALPIRMFRPLDWVQEPRSHRDSKGAGQEAAERGAGSSPVARFATKSPICLTTSA